MISWGWFEVEDDEISGLQIPFVNSVQSCAEGWDWCEPSDTMVLVDENQLHDRLRLIVDVPNPISGSVLSTLGVFFTGSRIECGELHTQDYTSLLASSRLKGLTASGAPEELGRAAAAWLTKTGGIVRSL